MALETVQLDMLSLERPLFSLPVVDPYPCGHDCDDSNHFICYNVHCSTKLEV